MAGGIGVQRSIYSTCFLVFLCVVSRHFAAADTCKGCLNFDEFSFNKIVTRFKYTLVKYDIAYPYGPKHDAFVQFAETLNGVKDVIVGDVSIKEYGQKDNEDFAKAQKVDPTKLPVIKLYKGIDVEDAVTFSEDVTIEKLQEFLATNSDIHVTLPGCVEVLDRLAAKFIHSSEKEQQLKQVEDYVTNDASELRAKKVYLLYMKKLREDDDFVTKEHMRLKKILTEGKVAETKKQDLQSKVNILHSFENKERKLKQEL